MTSVRCSEGQSLFDLAIQLSGSAEGALALAILNGVSLTDQLTPGTTIICAEEKAANVVSYLSRKNLKPSSYGDTVSDAGEVVVQYRSDNGKAPSGVKANENQSLFDLAIQLSGSAEAVVSLAILNGLSITDELSAGQQLQIPEVLNADVVSYLSKKNLSPETAGNGDLFKEGIGYWAIGVDFIVS